MALSSRPTLSFRGAGGASRTRTRNLDMFRAKHFGIPGSVRPASRAVLPRNDERGSRSPREGTRLSRADQRDRLVAFIEIQQAAQRLAALAREFRIVLQDPQRLVAGLRDELRMDFGPRDAEARHA